MQLLDAVNLCLRGSGQAQVNAVSARDENAQMVKNVINRERRTALSGGYIFNTNIITLQANPSGRVPLSSTFFRVRFPERALTYRDDINGDGNRYVWDQEQNDWRSDDVSDVEVVFDIEDFQRLPHLFADWIAKQSRSVFYADSNKGTPNPLWAQEAMLAKSKAINSVITANMNNGTGWNSLRVQGAAAAVKSAGEWIVLG